MNVRMLKEISFNKKIITNFIFSLLSLFSIIIMTILLGLNHNYITVNTTNASLNNYYYAIIGSVVVLIICYLINFVIAFFIDANSNKLFWSIKVTSWIFLLNSFTWAFDIWCLLIYNKNDDSSLKINNEWLKKQIKTFLLLVFFFSLLSITLLVIGIVGQITWDKNGHEMLFLPLAFWSLLSWSVCINSSINATTLIKWRTNKKITITNLFLIIFPSLTSLALLFKR